MIKYLAFAIFLLRTIVYLQAQDENIDTKFTFSHRYFLNGSFYQYKLENYPKAILYYDSLLTDSEALNSLEDRESLICQTKYRLAVCHRTIRNFNYAKQYFSQSVLCGQNPYLCFIALADIYLKEDQLDSAEKYLQLALVEDTTKAEVHYGLGKLYKEQGQYEKAIPFFEACIQKGVCEGSYFCDAYFHKAQCENNLGNYHQALTDINEHLKNNDTDYLAAGLKAAILYSLEDYIESAKHYTYYLVNPHIEQDEVIYNMVGLCNWNLYQIDPDKYSFAYKAFDWFKKSADLGYYEGQFNLGRCYLLGAGTEKDEKKAYDLTLLAAQQNDEMAQYFLGRLYSAPYDTTWYDKTQEFWFKRSAQQGYAKAQYHLAILYYNGEGVPINLEEAKYWMYQAKISGLREAIEAWQEVNFE